MNRAQVETRNVWQVFNKLSDEQLDALLTGAGAIVPKRRFVKLEAVMLVWFSGEIPDKREFNRLNMVAVIAALPRWPVMVK